jgi:3-oxoacyl-[acyl-carrier protein] reductase
MSLDEWHSVVETNLDGVFYCSKLGAEVLRDGGRIVNIASIAGIVGFHGQANYAAAKAGVAGMTRALARELGSRGITVNCVAPGLIVTGMTDKLTAQQRTRLAEAIPAGRFGAPGEVAAAVVYLASTEAAYVTGQTLHINGGMVMV